MTHSTNCPALDPFAHLLGDHGKCNCGGNDDEVIRLSESYLVVTSRSGFEHEMAFPTHAEARRLADSEARDIGGPVYIWFYRAAVIQPPEIPPPPDCLERVA